MVLGTSPLALIPQRTHVHECSQDTRNIYGDRIRRDSDRQTPRGPKTSLHHHYWNEALTRSLAPTNVPGTIPSTLEYSISASVSLDPSLPCGPSPKTSARASALRQLVHSALQPHSTPGPRGMSLGSPETVPRDSAEASAKRMGSSASLCPLHSFLPLSGSPEGIRGLSALGLCGPS